MYCSSCGEAVKTGLSYCKRCGAELIPKERSANKDIEESSKVSQESLVWAIVSVTIAGIGVIIGLMAVMKEVVHFNQGVITAFAILSFLIVLAADSLFIWMLLRSMRGVKEANDMTRLTEQVAREISAAQDRVDRALAEPPLSVTEHTTRSLEPADSRNKTE
ncbi:MAG: hypothetical protein L0229_15405 [Blastocatellia bacterium]|nr:hypothetical protein [Blastocatellia bacterium]